LRQVEAELAQEPAHLVDPRSARRHPAGADAVQPLQGLLAFGLDRHRQDIAAAVGPGKAEASARSVFLRRT